MEYPKTFDACPFCRCAERIVETEVEEEKKAGKIQPQRVPCSNQKLVPIRDPAGSALIFPVLMIHYDYCARCGYEYPHVITKQKMTWDQFQTLYLAAMGITTQQAGP